MHEKRIFSLEIMVILIGGLNLIIGLIASNSLSFWNILIGVGGVVTALLMCYDSRERETVDYLLRTFSLRMFKTVSSCN